MLSAKEGRAPRTLALLRADLPRKETRMEAFVHQERDWSRPLTTEAMSRATSSRNKMRLLNGTTRSPRSAPEVVAIFLTPASTLPIVGTTDGEPVNCARRVEMARRTDER